MLYLKAFCFNPFQQNTYVLYESEKAAWIIDPGNATATEHSALKDFVHQHELRPERLLLTHAHLDHILGNRFVYDTWGLLPEVHANDLFFIQRMAETAAMYGIPFEQSPMPENYLQAGQLLQCGAYTFECLFTPGHSPGSLSFYNAENKILLSGDVLFKGSIGRSDLPMGDHDTLIRSIREQLLVLDNGVKVYSGHGPATTIGNERQTNPFLT